MPLDRGAGLRRRGAKPMRAAGLIALLKVRLFLLFRFLLVHFLLDLRLLRLLRRRRRNRR